MYLRIHLHVVFFHINSGLAMGLVVDWWNIKSEASISLISICALILSLLEPICQGNKSVLSCWRGDVQENQGMAAQTDLLLCDWGHWERASAQSSCCLEAERLMSPPSLTHGKAIGDSFCMDQNSKTRIAGQLREKNGLSPDHIFLIPEVRRPPWPHVHRKGHWRSKGEVTSRDALPIRLFSKIHLG